MSVHLNLCVCPQLIHTKSWSKTEWAEVHSWLKRHCCCCCVSSAYCPRQKIDTNQRRKMRKTRRRNTEVSVKQGMKESTVDHLSSETLNLVYLEPVPYNNNNKKISKSSPGKVCIRHHCFQHRDYFTPAAPVENKWHKAGEVTSMLGLRPPQADVEPVWKQS